jgi:tRNA-2-methylthio-N6-dimethylallyladenosine synthase
MNKAESVTIANYLELFGYEPTDRMKNADIVVLNTCVVRQNAENKVTGTLGYLKGIKSLNPGLRIIVTGCFVHPQIESLQRKYPHIDLFFKPGQFDTFLSWARQQDIGTCNDRVLLRGIHDASPVAFLSISQGCDNFCSYCVVPYRRGREKSRLLEDILEEANDLVQNGKKEIILLGQNVNSYGHDLPEGYDLRTVLTEINRIDGLARIRFLTSHPKDFSPELIQAIAALDKVCEHICLPFQSGDNDILSAMRRFYTAEQYYQIITDLRHYVPQIALSTDVIVGFPGETDEQFSRTVAMLEKVQFDTVHVAAYSPRPNTITSRQFDDNVPELVKKERFELIEQMQLKIATALNSRFKGRTVEVLVEGKKGHKWYGRTRGDKLVFFNKEGDFSDSLVDVKITRTSPWSLQGDLVENQVYPA